MGFNAFQFLVFLSEWNKDQDRKKKKKSDNKTITALFFVNCSNLKAEEKGKWSKPIAITVLSKITSPSSHINAVGGKAHAY